MVVALVALLALTLLPDIALAQSSPMQMQGITNFGCSVVQWLKGPLALLIFVLVCVVVLVFGMITKMDWGRIISVCIIFGILISLPSLLTSTGLVSNNFGLTSCLQ
jgi:type IV secretory pathway VirB2 component (pilin)